MKAFKYNIFFAMLLWIVIVFGMYILDQNKIDSCLDSGKFFNYSSFSCSSMPRLIFQEIDDEKAYLKARYPIFAGASVFVVLYIGAVTVFYAFKEVQKYSGEHTP